MSGFSCANPAMSALASAVTPGRRVPDDRQGRAVIASGARAGRAAGRGCKIRRPAAAIRDPNDLSAPPPNEFYAKGWSGEPGHAAAVAFWRNLGLRIDDEEFRNAGAEAQSLAVSIAGVGELKLLQAFKDAVGKGIERDLSVDQVKEQICEELNPGSPGDSAGKDSVTVLDLEVMYGYEEHLDSEIRSGMSRARHAGLWREVQRKAVGEGGGFHFQYSADFKGSACEGHRSLHGLVRPHDDPVWRDLWPPNGPGCGCSVNALDPSQASAPGLALTSDEKLAEMRSGLDGNCRFGSFPAEHFLLPYADATARKFKFAEDSIEQHRNNAIEWEALPGLGEALRQRYESGVDAFAVDKHDVSSRGEMSIDMAVLPAHVPKQLGGYVLSVTDKGYKTVQRELIKRLKVKAWEDRHPASVAAPVESEPGTIAKNLMKTVLHRFESGNKIAIGVSDFLVSVLDDHIWIGFDFKIDVRSGLHYYAMCKAIYVRGLKYWIRQRRGKHNRYFEIFSM